MSGPLEGVRVLDWTQWQMGPVATAMLADLGASVIHIENRIKGDGGRAWNVRSDGVKVSRAGYRWVLAGGKSAYFEINNRGKKSMTLDLTKEKGKEVVYRLIKSMDVFVHNVRQGVPERLGLDYDTLSKYNPKLIYAAASGYGPKGPDAREPSYDLVGLARSGIMTMVGEPDMPPLVIQGGIADQIGGIMTAYGVLAALVARERLGIGQKVDASQLGSMIALQGLTVGVQLYVGWEEMTRVSRKKAANPLWNYYPCKDGTWFELAMAAFDQYAPLVFKALGVENLEKDPRFNTPDKRAENCEEMISIMDKIFITRSASEWKKMFKETGDIVCSVVQTISDLGNDPQVLANDYVVNCNHETLGPVKVVGIPIQLSKTPGKVKCEAPEFGQHTEEVLIDIGGYSWEEISRLREEEII